MRGKERKQGIVRDKRVGCGDGKRRLQENADMGVAWG